MFFRNQSPDKFNYKKSYKVNREGTVTFENLCLVRKTWPRRVKIDRCCNRDVHTRDAAVVSEETSGGGK
jgi:hypothetical protein